MNYLRALTQNLDSAEKTPLNEAKTDLSEPPTDRSDSEGEDDVAGHSAAARAIRDANALIDDAAKAADEPPKSRPSLFSRFKSFNPNASEFVPSFVAHNEPTLLGQDEPATNGKNEDSAGSDEEVVLSDPSDVEDDPDVDGDDDAQYSSSEDEHPAVEEMKQILAERDGADVVPPLPVAAAQAAAHHDDHPQASARSNFDLSSYVDGIVQSAASKVSPAPTPRPAAPAAPAAPEPAAQPQAAPAASRASQEIREAATEAPQQPQQPASGTGRAMPTLPTRRPMAKPGGLGSSGLPPKKDRTEDASKPSSSTPSAPEPAPAAAAAAAPAAQNGSGSAAPAPAAAPAALAAREAGPVETGPVSDKDEKKDVRRRRQDLHDLRVRLLRLGLRTQGPGVSANVLQQVLYRIDMAENQVLPLKDAALLGPATAIKAGPNSLRYQRARSEAEALERTKAGSKVGLKVTALCIGWVGAGKTTTINSLLGTKEHTAAFGDGTRRVRAVRGSAFGLDITMIDTPGLLPAASAKSHNEKVLRGAKRAYDKFQPDIVLYFERFDQPRRDSSDLGTLRSISEVLGPQVWGSTIVCMTHAAVAPPEGLRGPIAWDEFQQQRQAMVGQVIRASVQDGRLQVPFVLAENHPACRKNAAGEPVLPNDQAWRPNLALMLAGFTAVGASDKALKVRDKAPAAGSQADILRMMGLGGGYKLPPLPYVLQQLMQSRNPRRPTDDERDIKSEREIEGLPEAQRKEETRKRREFLKVRAEEAKLSEEDAGNVAITAPEPPLPPSFDPAETVLHRYRYLESSSGWIVRPILQQQTVDHDDGIDGVAMERSLMLRRRGKYLGGIPTFIMGQVQKDKQNMHLQTEAEGSWTRDNIPKLADFSLPGPLSFVDRTINTAGVTFQTLGGQGDYLWSFRNEARVYQAGAERNKVVVGTMVTSLTEGLPFKKNSPWTLGWKIEDRYKIRKGMKGSLAWGRTAVHSKYAQQSGWNLTGDFRMKTGHNDRNELSANASMMNFRNDRMIQLQLGGSVQATPQTTVNSRLTYNNKGQGSITVKVSSHDHVQIGYSLLVPVLGALWGKLTGNSSIV